MLGSDLTSNPKYVEPVKAKYLKTEDNEKLAVPLISKNKYQKTNFYMDHPYSSKDIHGNISENKRFHSLKHNLNRENYIK